MAGESLLVKPVSADCNMACSYCFYRRPDDPYASESRHIMDDKTLRAMIAGYMKSAGRCASFGWQGGEPLLAGIDFFKRVVEYQQRYGLSAQLVSNNLQTNGLLLNREWARFFKDYNFFVGVSLDGPEKYHNLYRHSISGESSFRRAVRGIHILRDHQVEFSILAVVNNLTVKKPMEIYDFFVRNGFFSLQFIPCVEIDKDTQRMKEFSVNAQEYRDFLCALFDAWYNNGKPIASIRLFENILAIYMGIEPEICAFRNRCDTYVVVEYNGDVYPCDFFVEKKWMLGNILESTVSEIFQNNKILAFSDAKTQQAGICNDCEWNFVCHFGCQHYRLNNGENYLCDAYRGFLSYTRERFDLLKKDLMRKE